MARWAVVTVVLYILLTAVLFMPLALWIVDKACGEGTSLGDVFFLHTAWQGWLAAAVILLAQLLMLIFPVRQYSNNSAPQRAIWAVLFYCFGRAGDMSAFAQRLSKWLIHGSIVELLVAVPCHIIVRHRNDC